MCQLNNSESAASVASTVTVPPTRFGCLSFSALILSSNSSNSFALDLRDVQVAPLLQVPRLAHIVAVSAWQAMIAPQRYARPPSGASGEMIAGAMPQLCGIRLARLTRS
jgi:hypothetical protein